MSVPIVLFWLVVAGLTNALVPQLEVVGEEHNVALSSPDSPSLQAFKKIGEVFNEFDSDSAAMIVLEGDEPLGADAHQFYDTLIERIEQDHKHVQHVQDFWGDPLTAAGSQSSDGKAAYVQVFLTGNQGEAQSIASVEAVRDIVNSTPAPPGIKAYVAGPAPQVADQFEVGNEGTTKVTVLTVLVIAVMLLLVYRSIVTMLLVLITVLIEMSAARGIVAFLGNSGIIGLSTYSTNILTLLVIAAGTDYAIFLLGRYHEDRGNGIDRETAYYNMYRGTAHVILGSGLTVAGAVLVPELHPAALFPEPRRPRRDRRVRGTGGGAHPGSRRDDHRRPLRTAGSQTRERAQGDGAGSARRSSGGPGRSSSRRWRWPRWVFWRCPATRPATTSAIYMPDRAPSNIGYAAAERHFSKARLNPELLMIEADHDLRNPTDMILLERVAKAVFHTAGIAQVQSITRPLGTPLDHTSIPFQISAQSAGQIQNLGYQQDRANDLLKQVDEIDKTIGILRQQATLQGQANAATHEQVEAFHQTVAVAQDLRDKIANFDDFFRPLRNYFYWEPHCYDIPICFALRSLFDALDGINALTDQLANVTTSLDKLDSIQPKLLDLIPPQLASQQINRDLVMTNYATLSGIYDQNAAALENSTAMGAAFDASKTDDSFYVPPEVFDNAEFQRGLKLFLSPDGKAAQDDHHP